MIFTIANLLLMGFLAIRKLAPSSHLPVVIGASFPVGFTCYAFLCVIIASITGYSDINTATNANIILLAISGLLFYSHQKRNSTKTPANQEQYKINLELAIRHIKDPTIAILPIAIAFITFMAIYGQVNAMVSHGQHAGTMLSSHPNNFSDFYAHWSYITHLADCQWPPVNPMYSAGTLAYPFISDYGISMLIAGGADIVNSLRIVTLLLTVSFAIMMYGFARELGSKRIWATMVVALFIFGSGFGFFYAIADWINGDKSLVQFLMDQPRGYAEMRDKHIHYSNVLTSMFIPQRAFTLGFPMGLFSLYNIWKFSISNKKQKGYLLLATIATGLMPLVHTHSFLAIFLICVPLSIGCIATGNKGQKFKMAMRWGMFALGVSLLAIPQIISLSSNVTKEQFFKKHIGWMSTQTDYNWLTFWFINYGPSLIIMAFAIAYGLRSKKIRPFALFSLAASICFIATNTYQFAPWIWDNTKIMIWSFIILAIMAAVSISTLLDGTKNNYQPLVAALVSAIMFTGMVSGMLESTRIGILSLKDGQYSFFDHEKLSVAQKIEEVTKRGDVIACDPSIWQPAAISSRAVVAGPIGMLWSHGIGPELYLDALEELLAGVNVDSNAKKLNAQYLCIKRESTPKSKDAERRLSRYKVVFEENNWILIDLRNKIAKKDSKINGDIFSEVGTWGWSVKLWDNTKFRGKPNHYFTRASSIINSDKGKKMANQPCSAILTKVISIPETKMFEFSLVSDDGAKLYIDGKEILNNIGNPLGTKKNQRTLINKGKHIIEVHYFDTGGGQHLYLKVKEDGQEKENNLEDTKYFR